MPLRGGVGVECIRKSVLGQHRSDGAGKPVTRVNLRNRAASNVLHDSKCGAHLCIAGVALVTPLLWEISLISTSSGTTQLLAFSTVTCSGGAVSTQTVHFFKTNMQSNLQIHNLQHVDTGCNGKIGVSRVMSTAPRMQLQGQCVLLRNAAEK
jgi:hypothetical protein